MTSYTSHVLRYFPDPTRKVFWKLIPVPSDWCVSYKINKNCHGTKVSDRWTLTIWWMQWGITTLTNCLLRAEPSFGPSEVEFVSVCDQNCVFRGIITFVATFWSGGGVLRSALTGVCWRNIWHQPTYTDYSVLKISILWVIFGCSTHFYRILAFKIDPYVQILASKPHLYRPHIPHTLNMGSTPSLRVLA